MLAIRARLKEKRKQKKRLRVTNKFLLKKFKKIEPKKKWYSNNKRFAKHLSKENPLPLDSKINKKTKKIPIKNIFVPKTNALNKLNKTKNKLKKLNIFVPKTNALISNNVCKPLKINKIQSKNLNAKKKNKTKNKTKKNNQKGNQGNKNKTNYTNLFPKKRTIAYKYIKEILFFESLSVWCINSSRN